MNKSLVEQYVKLEREHWWFRVRSNIIRHHLKQHLAGTRGLRILNIGAAGGATSRLLEEFGSVSSVEIEKYFLEHLKAIKVPVVEGSVLQLPFEDAGFDLVCAFDVIEHVADDSLALAEIKRVCKAGGSIFITVPASMSLWSDHDEANGHHRRYSKIELRGLFKKASGLTTLECRYFNFLLFPAIWVARKVSKMTGSIGKNPKSDFERYQTSGMLNRLAGKIFGLEANLLPHFEPPFGVSLLAVLKKQSNNN